MKSRLGVVVCLLLVLGGSADAATYYIGQFSGCSGGSCNDEAGCGTPRSNACATLAYWTQNRRGVLGAGDTVRIAPGTYTGSGNPSHCIVPQLGVTYEGRSAADGVLDDFTSVVLDMQGIGTGGTCAGQWLSCRNGCNFESFTVRDMQFRYAPANSGGDTCVWLNPSGCSGGVCNDLTIDRVRFYGCNAGRGVDIGVNGVCPKNSGGCTRAVQGLVVVDSEFAEFTDDALYLGLVDGFTIEDTTVHNNGPAWCTDPAVSAQCNGMFDCQGECNDGDGIAYHGAINGTVRRVGTYQNRQYGHDFTRTGEGAGDDCDTATYGIVVEDSWSRDSGLANYSFSGCAAHVTIRNSWAWGTGDGIHLYFGACGIRAYNNTFVMDGWDAFWAFSRHSEIDLRNNILASTGSRAVRLSDSITGSNAMGIWDGNVVVATGGSNAIQIFASDNTASPQSDPDYDCATSGTLRGNGQSFADSAAGLSTWRSSNYMSGGGSTAANDPSWGTLPSFVDAGSPSVANLHLLVGDVVAQGQGLDLGVLGIAGDADGQGRSIPWDVGADEVSSTTVTTTSTPPASTSSTSSTSSSTTSTAPQACDADGECDDQSLCTAGDRCEAGFCAREAVSCSEGTACAPGRCDAAAGCVIEQAPNGTPCDLGDPCLPGVCNLGTCAGPLVARTGGHFLSVSRFVIRKSRKRTRLLARASFTLSAPLDPTASGFAFDVSAPSGRVLYGVSLPPRAFAPPRRRGSRLRYRLPRRVAAETAPDVRRLVIVVDGEVADVRVEATTETLARARTGDEPSLRWVVRAGAECVSDPGLVCAADGERTSCS